MTELVVTNCTNSRHRPKRSRPARFRCGICESDGHTNDRIVSYATWKAWKEASGR